MAALPRPEVHAIILRPSGGDSQPATVTFAAKVIRDGKTWAWSGEAETDELAFQRCVAAMLDDPHTAEHVREG